MSNIKNLEMAEAIANCQHIVVKKSLFSHKVVYQPTGSDVEVIVNEYSQAEGDRLERLMHLPLDKMAAELKQNGRPKSTAVGPLRMEALRSKDGQFCAVQLFRFGDFKYHAVSEWISSEGSDAAVLAEVIDR